MSLVLTHDRRRRAALGRRQPPGHSLLNGLVEFWPLSEQSGVRLGAHTGLHMGLGTSPGGGDGPAGSLASAFSGSQYLTRANEAALQTGAIDWTWTGWVLLTAKNTIMGIYSRDYDTASREMMIYYYGGSLDYFYANVFDAANKAIEVEGKSAGHPPLNTWLYLAIWHQVGVGLSMQVNCGSIDSTATNGTPTAKNTVTEIGTDLQSRYWQGRLARIGFWKRLLTADERLWLYNAGCGRDYPFM